MNNPTDFLRKKFGPLKARNLKNAIATRSRPSFHASVVHAFVVYVQR